ncbi:MAG: hypothetical protein A4E65_02816 [Syntrophorhabdus sp. PtaU1.Bin153]|nr:MAG: hypothetical protein A4E65_02816 [Syntrophorhabdus sp. PtaU1.Bin153]
MRKSWLLMTLIVFSLFVCVPALADEGKDESGKGKDRKLYSEKYDKKKDESGKGKYHGGNGDRESYFQRHGYTQLSIPPGHYPPPGECRIWYPDRPPGQQPPSAGCSQVPPGAWVITHPKDRSGYAHVTVYDPQRPGSVYVEGEFDIGSGTFIRAILNR